MSKLVTLPSGQMILYRGRKPGALTRARQQAIQACGQFLDHVDIDRLRNQVKHLPILNWLLVGRENTIAFRKLVHKEATLRDQIFLPIFEAENQRRRLFRLLRLPAAKPEEIRAYTRIEKVGLLVCAAFAIFTFTTANATGDTKPFVAIDSELVATIESYVAPGPKTWLSGTPEAKGGKEAVMGAYTYALESGYTFAKNETERDQLVANGTLVKLEGPYLKLVDVSEPYALPATAAFVNRLGQQYAEHGCGKLEVSGAMRNLDHQATLGNGSDHSVHPTGMPVDLRRLPPESKAEVACLDWLERTLLSIEKKRRVDMTVENHPRHFHVVVATHDYARWLALQPKGLDPELKWLATALYFEAAFNESMEGYRAIGWAIRNRVRSKEFPNTIVEVVAQGAAGRNTGGCQFSFMCDGKAEHIQTLCAQPNTVMSQYWLGKCDERWEGVVKIAEQILTETNDPTGGAVLYYAASLDKAPYWADVDMKPGTVHRIGSHIFSCSLHRGKDACRS